MPSWDDLQAVVYLAAFAAVLGATWVMGRSKYRDKLIDDLQDHNALLQEKNRTLLVENETLRNGFRQDILDAIAEGLA